MVVLSQPALDRISFVENQKPVSYPRIPTIDLSNHESKTLLVKACEEFGFFKGVNHGIPLEFIDRLEAEAVKFVSLSQPENEKAGHANSFGYGNKRIGPNGDVGWIEYLLFQTNANSISQRSWAISRENPEIFCSAVSDYISAVKKLACGVLESLTEGLKVEPMNIFSKLLMDEESDSFFRLNHYPPCPELKSIELQLNWFWRTH
ncbi:gibberellin 2-beta-dioxygenase 1-like [Magnolia sinica]|uniref:gibberellin 2-beta-dioxygenase 1-like n=1 Tax=Magnolia sinica TaxID=86752 RepID=UPI00265AAB23|nr:gibberellin 2-beta-dioxygenase 1-like [Magnolia sinica]